MKYEIKIQMSDNLDSDIFDCPEERFQSAVNCTKERISLILYDHPIVVDGEGNKIMLLANKSDLFTVRELRKILDPAFCDNDGKTYPEFYKICIQKI